MGLLSATRVSTFYYSVPQVMYRISTLLLTMTQSSDYVSWNETRRFETEQI